MAGEMPAFPPFSGTEQLPRVLKQRIAAAAWEAASGDEKEFRRLCVQHARGDIDLFADKPAETDATPRLQAAEAQREIERSLVPQPQPEPQPGPVAEEAAPAAGRSVPRRAEPERAE